MIRRSRTEQTGGPQTVAPTQGWRFEQHGSDQCVDSHATDDDDQSPPRLSRRHPLMCKHVPCPPPRQDAKQQHDLNDPSCPPPLHQQQQRQEHAEGDVVAVEFEVREYRGKIELTVRKLWKVNEFIAEDYIVVNPAINGEDLIRELRKRIDSIRDFHLRQLVDAFFDDEEFFRAFTTSPAGMYIHHDYRHGLLQHVLEMLEILDGIMTIYPDMNRDLVTTGTFFHDVGKIRELSTNLAGVTDYTKEGQLIGHIGIGLLMLEKRLPEDFPESLRLQLFHIIVSHQGKRETGSPILPASREALSVYYADTTSTFLNIADNERKKGVDRYGDTRSFSDYNRYIGSSVFIEP